MLAKTLNVVDLIFSPAKVTMTMKSTEESFAFVVSFYQYTVNLSSQKDSDIHVLGGVASVFIS